MCQSVNRPWSAEWTRYAKQRRWHTFKQIWNAGINIIIFKIFSPKKIVERMAFWTLYADMFISIRSNIFTDVRKMMTAKVAAATPFYMPP
jgi:hypothetical protein